MEENYLLTTPWARKLYEAVRGLPLIDYHNHLNVRDIRENRRFRDIYELWLASDPYKHRVMRICGIDEALITGSAGAKEKFRAFCGVYPRLMGGPLYDWCRMELGGVLGIRTPILPENADRIWDEAAEKLAGEDFRAGNLLRRFGAEYTAPCAGVLDDLSFFDPDQGVVPSLRGDDMAHPTADFISRLEKLSGKAQESLDAYIDALAGRMRSFHALGCRFSDHALDDGFAFAPCRDGTDALYRRARAGERIPAAEQQTLTSEVLLRLMRQYQKLGWSVQLHIGALRRTSTRLRAAAGPAGGFAGIGSDLSMAALSAFLDAAEQAAGKLPRIILYTLNPAYNAAFAILSGSFVGVTQGPAWWWCDHLQGMREMLERFSVYSVLSAFPGMTTDSRSLLSMSRHGYFRRMLCGWLGEKMEKGEMPRDMEAMKELAIRLCYQNAKDRTI